MFYEEFRIIKSERKDIRNFSLVFFIVFAILAWYFGHKGHSVYIYFAILSAAFLICSIFVPVKLLRPIQRLWMGLSIVLGTIVSYTILTVIFFLVFVPIGFFMRRFKGDWLHLYQKKLVDSYWIKRDQEEVSHFRQF